MTVKELIEELEKYDKNVEVMIPCDETNLGPVKTINSRYNKFIELLPTSDK